MEDGALVRSIAARDDLASASAAEAELCRRFAPRAYLYGRRHLRDDERARDLAQTVMLAVIEAVRAGRIAEPEHIDRFVLGTCRNVLNRVRDVEARARPTDMADLESLATVEALEPADTGALVRCMAELDGRERTLLLLSFNEERSADQIAVALGTTAGNVRVLRHRAIARLRRCIDACQEASA